MSEATNLPALKGGKMWNLTPSNMGEALKYAEMIASSDIIPKDYKGKPGNVLVAVQMGGEIGLSPMQSLQNIAVINGFPSVWGDALPALARSHPKCEYIDERYDADLRIATCTVKRRGEPPQTRQFTWKDAELAGLASKDTYKKFPGRMLPIRARAWAIRDVFPDALKGLTVAEEMQDLILHDTDYSDINEKPVSGMAGLAQATSRAGAPTRPAVVRVDEETGEIVFDREEVIRRIGQTANLTELEALGLELNAIPNDHEHRGELRKLYKERFHEHVTKMTTPAKPKVEEPKPETKVEEPKPETTAEVADWLDEYGDESAQR